MAMKVISERGDRLGVEVHEQALGNDQHGLA